MQHDSEFPDSVGRHGLFRRRPFSASPRQHLNIDATIKQEKINISKEKFGVSQLVYELALLCGYRRSPVGGAAPKLHPSLLYRQDVLI